MAGKITLMDAMRRSMRPDGPKVELLVATVMGDEEIVRVTIKSGLHVYAQVELSPHDFFLATTGRATMATMTKGHRSHDR